MFESLTGIAALFILIGLRIPIAFSMMIVGIIGYGLLRSWDSAFRLAGNAALDIPLSYTLSVIPLFVLMGNLLTFSGISGALFVSSHRLLHNFKGGLAMSTVVACGGFSAVCGSSLATARNNVESRHAQHAKIGVFRSSGNGFNRCRGHIRHLNPPFRCDDYIWSTH